MQKLMSDVFIDHWFVPSGLLISVSKIKEMGLTEYIYIYVENTIERCSEKLREQEMKIERSNWNPSV